VCVCVFMWVCMCPCTCIVYMCEGGCVYESVCLLSLKMCEGFKSVLLSVCMKACVCVYVACTFSVFVYVYSGAYLPLFFLHGSVCNFRI
jgi:hypothetical protein